MNLKTKITLAFLTMLLLLLSVSGFTLYSLNRLDRSARNVLQDNLYSVELGQHMLRALDQLQRQEAPLDTQAKQQFEQLLAREAGNVTEPGEQQVVDSLFSELAATERYLASDTTAPQLWTAHMGQLRHLTYRMVNLNTQALTRKNEAANRLASEQSGYVLALLTFAVLICLLFVLSVPEAAVSGLRKLSASIENATHQDYSNSIPVESHDEFGSVARAFNRLLVQLQDYRTSTLAQLLAERNRMVNLVNNLDEGLLLVDENRRLILANPVAQQLLALPPEQLLNRPAEEIAQQNDLFRELLRHLDTPAAQRPTEAAPVLTLAQHDEEAYYRVSVNDVVSFNEALDKMEFVGSILTLRNVSEYKKLDQAKSNFLATVSHELKTPLSSINFSLKLLQNGKVGPVNEEQQNILATIKQENQRLLRLVGELIDVSRLESGNIQLNFQAARVAEVVQFAADTIQLQPKQLTLDVQIADTLPPVRADIEKTTWVLLNLLANAIRYSPEQAQIHIRAALTTEAQPQVRISVQDHGPGIAPQYQEKIFQRFVQIPDKNGYKGGSGLGLSIAREFIGSQGGQLWVESELGSGSTFSFALPLARPE